MFLFSGHLGRYVTVRYKINLEFCRIISAPESGPFDMARCKWQSVICFHNYLHYFRALDDVLNISKLTSKAKRTTYRKAGWIVDL